jgi:hypothetical protein
MPATEGTVERRPDLTPLGALGAALGACAGALEARALDVSAVWAAAGRTLLELVEGGGQPMGADAEAELLLLDAAAEPLVPPWLIVDALIALVVDHLAIDSPPHLVVEVDGSLAGLRRLGALLRPSPQGAW